MTQALVHIALVVKDYDMRPLTFIQKSFISY